MFIIANIVRTKANKNEIAKTKGIFRVKFWKKISREKSNSGSPSPGLKSIV